MYSREHLEKPLPFPYFAWVIQSGKPKQILVMAHKLLPEGKVQLTVQSTVLYSRTVAIKELYSSEFEAGIACKKNFVINNAKAYFEIKDDHVQAATV